MQQSPSIGHGGCGPHEYHPAAQALVDDIAQQRIIRAGQTQVDDLHVSVQCSNQRSSESKRIATGGVGVVAQLPAGFEDEEARPGCDPDDALVIVGDRGYGAGHFRAVPITPEPAGIGIDEIVRRRDSPAQVRVPDVGPRVHDGHLHSVPGRPGMGLEHVHLAKPELQLHVGVVVIVAARGEGLQGLREPDTRVGRDRREQRGAIGAVGDLEHRAMHVERLDRPFADLTESIVPCQRPHERLRARCRAISRDAVVAVRRAPRTGEKGRGIVIDGGNDITLAGLAGDRAKCVGFDARRRGAARTQQGERQTDRRPSIHGDSPSPRVSPGRVLSAKRTAECRRSNASEAFTGRSVLAAKE